MDLEREVVASFLAHRAASKPLQQQQSEGEAKRLDARQRLYMATVVLERVRADADRARIEHDRAMERLRVATEAAEARAADLKREAWEFRRDVGAVQLPSTAGGGDVNDGGGSSNNKVSAESVLRHLDEKNAARAAELEKMRLRTATLQNQIARTEKDQRRQDDQAEGFLPIDFHQLKIENQQFQERIDARNAELLRLKVTAASAVHMLNKFRRRLDVAVKENARVKQRIKQQSDLLVQLDREGTTVDKEKTRAGDTNARLRTQQETYRVPEVFDYIGLLSTLEETRKKVLEWERKVEIAQLAARRK